MNPSLHAQKGSGGTQQGTEMTGQLESAKEAARRQRQTGSQRDQGPKMGHVITDPLRPAGRAGREKPPLSTEAPSSEVRGSC